MEENKLLTPLEPKPEAIPEELKTLRQWVVWQGNKIPVNPNSGKPAKSNDPTTWGTFDQGWNYYERHKTDVCKGIGFMFSPDDPYTGIDLDKCINPETGEMESWAKDIINQMDSYTELSPSGTGVHMTCPPKTGPHVKLE